MVQTLNELAVDLNILKEQVVDVALLKKMKTWGNKQTNKIIPPNKKVKLKFGLPPSPKECRAGLTHSTQPPWCSEKAFSAAIFSWFHQSLRPNDIFARIEMHLVNLEDNAMDVSRLATNRLVIAVVRPCKENIKEMKKIYSKKERNYPSRRWRGAAWRAAWLVLGPPLLCSWSHIRFSEGNILREHWLLL